MIDSCNLLGELAKIRLLIAESTSPGLTRSLCETAAKLTKEIDRQDTLRSKFLHFDAVQRVMRGVLDIISEEMSILPEDVRNRIIDATCARITDELATAQNTPAEIKRIERK